MKHYILIEFTANKPLPKDFTDMVAGRVYIMDQVEKKDLTATMLTQEQVEAIREAD